MVLVVFSMVSISKHHSWYYSSQTQALCVRTKRGRSRDLPGGPVSRTLLSWCKGLGFDSWSGNWVLHAATETQHSQINLKNKEINKVKVIVCLTYLISVGKRDPSSSTSTWADRISCYLLFFCHF